MQESFLFTVKKKLTKAQFEDIQKDWKIRREQQNLKEGTPEFEKIQCNFLCGVATMLSILNFEVPSYFLISILSGRNKFLE
jgi:hypothetical protein